ncbi:site-specific DNA-methyltransferase, partial [Escherichia coli]|nr:site-specific DNA-methyltransferase [Escherichia coli]
VADFFMGSGSTIKAALSLERRAIGVELEAVRFNQTVKEINALVVNQADKCYPEK